MSEPKQQETETGITNEELIRILKRSSLEKAYSVRWGNNWELGMNSSSTRLLLSQEDLAKAGYTKEEFIKFLESYLEHK